MRGKELRMQGALLCGLVMVPLNFSIKRNHLSQYVPLLLFVLFDYSKSVGTWRVGGVLAVSRAFGDKLLKPYVVADPEIKEEVVDSSLEFLILASDGLWDVVTNEEAVAMVKPIQDPQEAANKLLEEASRRGSSDNITVIIVRFIDGTTGEKSGDDKETTNDQHS
uniref:protein-serine/threonine phosphatase n=1 Tax=Zea mays TaxID=4577 RepID=A0A804P4I5_MAIZE